MRIKNYLPEIYDVQLTKKLRHSGAVLVTGPKWRGKTSYTKEQMELSLREAEADYQNGRHTSHSSICERYGV